MFQQRCKKISVLLLIVFLFIAILPLPLQAVELPLTAASAILVDAHSGKILYEKEPHKKLYPASMTKLMTLVLAMDAIESGKINLDDVVVASENAASFRGSHIFLSPGEELTLHELLLGIALASGNDAAVAVAEYISGTHEAFINLMNNKAKELGMKGTNFANCNGLHNPNHYSTTYDFSLLARYALKHSQILEICSVKHYRIRTETKRPFQYDNKNKLLWFYPGTDGFKTGWTEDAKYCFVGTCQKDNLRLISVVMGVPAPQGHFSETKTLFNYGFSQFTFKEFCQENEIIGEIYVGEGKENKVDVVPEGKVGIILPKGEDKDITAEIELVPFVNAPVNKGDVVGYISIVKNGEILSRANLLVKEDVAKGSLWQMIKKVFKGVVTM